MIRGTGSRGINTDFIVWIPLPLGVLFLLSHLKDKQTEPSQKE